MKRCLQAAGGLEVSGEREPARHGKGHLGGQTDTGQAAEWPGDWHAEMWLPFRGMAQSKHAAKAGISEQSVAVP